MKNQRRIKVAEIGWEGGGVTIYGKRNSTGWEFWEEGSSWGLDENDDEVHRTWVSEPVTELSTLLPNDWPCLFPVSIHPEFLPWFCTHYEKQRRSLPLHQRRAQERLAH